MNYENKRKWVVLFLGMCLIAMFHGSNFALMKGNDSNRAFSSTPLVGNQVIASGSSLRDYLIEGAGAFLNSYANALVFMNQIEMGELHGYDFTGMSQSIDRAILHMESAENFYVNLKNLADITPYNPEVIFALKRFHYSSYCNDFRLNKTIFRNVQGYLQWGDVRGAYGQMLTDTIRILDCLYRVKYALDDSRLPEGQLAWDLNQYYSDSLLFGQYMAGVFSEILKTL